MVDDTTGVPVYSFSRRPEILGAVERNMAPARLRARGPRRPGEPASVPVDADLAINVSVFTGTDYAYVPCDYWAWWGIPGYGCDLPWEWVAYRVGTLLMEMGDLGGSSPGPRRSSRASGPAPATRCSRPSNAENVQIAVGAVDQAFAQSPYLVTP